MKKLTLRVCIFACFFLLFLAGCPAPDAPNSTPVQQLETVATPTASLAEGTYTSVQSVTLSCDTAGAEIRYTTNGVNPTANTGYVYSGAITISTTTTLKAIAVKAGMNNSAILTVEYTINIPVPETVAMPTASPGSGSFSVSETVSLSCTTSGADIYYTLDRYYWSRRHCKNQPICVLQEIHQQPCWRCSKL